MNTRRGFMRGIMAAVAGAIGVPLAPEKAAGTTRFLREDGTWASITAGTTKFLRGNGTWTKPTTLTSIGVFSFVGDPGTTGPTFRPLTIDDLPKECLDSRSAPAT